MDQTIVIIIDEAQMLYENITTNIWSILKNAAQLPQNLIIIIFAAYGETVVSSKTVTPYDFPSQSMFGLEFMRLDNDEFDELVGICIPTLLSVSPRVLILGDHLMTGLSQGYE